VLPGSPGSELSRRPVWAQFADIRPAAVVRCATREDVAETIAFARRAGVVPVARGGGHCFAGRSSTRDVLIDLNLLRSVSPSDGIVTVGAGALLGEIYEQLDALGLTIVAGSCPTVGIAGLTLGGGLGVLGRRYGLTSDQLVGAEVALADGRVVVCDEQREPDLFWALRGAGGGHFGVVTSFTFRTVPAGDLTCFKLTWPYRHAATLIEAWQAWAPGARDELAASLLVNAAGDLGEPVVTLFGSMLGSEHETKRTLDELVTRLSPDPSAATIERMSYRAAKRFLFEHAPGAGEQDGAPQEPSRSVLMFSKSEFFQRPLPGGDIAALIDAFASGRAPGQARELDFTPWGGAYNRTPAGATAFVHRRERFLLKHAVVLDADASAQEQTAARDWLATSWSLVHRWGSGGVFPNFPDPELTDFAHAYHGDNYGRLTRVKARYDPDDVFRFPQSLPPALG
jgi:FAD/FMN-containing dehydrogenase